MKKKKAVTGSAPGRIRGFKTRKNFATWLEKNHETSPALWVRIARKASGVKSITYAEGVEVALCYGWIDAQKLPESETAWLQRFMPRRPRSIWSRINREKALALIASGQMTRLDSWRSSARRRTAAGKPPTIRKAEQACPRISRRNWSGTQKQSRSSRR